MRVDALFNTKEILDFSMANVVRHPITAGRFIRRRIYRRFGGHDVSYRIASDFDFLVRVCAAGLRSKVLERVTYTYRRHENSTTLSGNPEMVFVMMSDNIRVAETSLVANAISASDQKALIGMHSRCSIRLAWMLLRKRLFAQAFKVLGRAWRLNPIGPLLVPYWIFRGWYERRQLARAE